MGVYLWAPGNYGAITVLLNIYTMLVGSSLLVMVHTVFRW